MRKGRKKVYGFIAVVLAFVLIFPAVGLSLRDPLGPHICWLPYNVKSGDWATGVHIVTYLAPTLGESIAVQYWDVITNEKYAEVLVPLSDAGSWTGMVQDLLDTPADYRSGSLLVFFSTAGFFSVTQFVVNAGSTMPGFGHQTFYAEPAPDIQVE